MWRLIPVTRGTLNKLQDELNELLNRRKAIVEETKHTYDTDGYWHQNVSWEQLLKEQSMIRGRIDEIELVLANNQIIDDLEISTERVGLGRVVRIKCSNPNEEISLTILGPYDISSEEWIISDWSPLANALMGMKVGDTCVFRERTITILEITRWQPENC